MKYFLTMSLMGLALVFPHALLAQTTALTQATPPLPAPIQNLVNEGAQARYMGNDYGLDSWLTVKNGQEQYFYVMPGGKAFVMGVLFDDKGKLVTIDQLQKLRNSGDPIVDALADDAAALAAARAAAQNESQKPLSASDRMYSDIEGANWIPLGNPEAPIVYAFIDPQCPHCHAFIQDLRQRGALDQGLLQVRVVPVGFKPETQAQAAYLMAAPDPAARLLAHLDGDTQALPVKAEINSAGVARNVEIMQSWKMDATPFVVYRGRDGGLKIVRGNPKDMDGFLKDLPVAAATASPIAP
ncbi:MAG: thioredoxin fold domain-containing protein [Alphaproteobacteria bacterium]|nr:thioredoxin fold domain-containing protein [Alphaproteobacteria bacterium]